MIELFSVKDVSRIFDQKESRLRYWVQSGFLWPSVKKQGRFFYTFEDLVHVRTAIELLSHGIAMKNVRAALMHLRAAMPEDMLRTSVRISSDGERIVVDDGSCTFEPLTGQVVMDFDVASIEARIAQVVELFPKGGTSAGPKEGVPHLVEVESTEPDGLMASGYQLFKLGLEAEAKENLDKAEEYYRQAIDDEPTFSAAHTNLGNLLYQRGAMDKSRSCYERAIEHDPDQIEARYNLANILAEIGERERAIAELRRVVQRRPDFADAHYNLGVLLGDVGGHTQAEQHFTQYLEKDDDSPWATQAKDAISEGVSS